MTRSAEERAREYEAQAESIGRATLRRAGIEPTLVPAGGAVDVAIALYGGDILGVGAVAPDTARLVADRIVVRDGQPARRMHFAVARGVARLELRGRRGVAARLERQVAAYLVAPREALALVADSLTIADLGSHFAMTQTGIVRRLGEVGRFEGAVVSASGVLRFGTRMWLTDADLVRLAGATRAPSSLARVELTDEPGRVAIGRFVSKPRKLEVRHG